MPLKPEYLETLDIREHEIVFTFGYNVNLKTTFTINEKSSTPDDTTPTDDSAILSKDDNPHTSDDIFKYVILSVVSLLGIITSTIIYNIKK